jgi:hypothetical protein
VGLRICEEHQNLADWEGDSPGVPAQVLAQGQTGLDGTDHREICVTDAAHLPNPVIFNQFFEVLRKELKG